MTVPYGPRPTPHGPILTLLIALITFFCILIPDSEARLIIKYSRRSSNWEIDFTFDSGPCNYLWRSPRYCSDYWGTRLASYGWPHDCRGYWWGYRSYPRYYYVVADEDWVTAVNPRKSGRGRDYDLAYFEAAMARRRSELGMDVREAQVEFDENTERGHDLFRRGRYQEAARAYKQSLLLDENSAPPYIFFGQALLASGDYIYSAKSIRRGLGLMENVEAFAPRIAELFRDQSAYETCRETVRSLHSLDPSDPNAVFLLAWLLYWEGEREEAKSLCLEALRLSPSWQELSALMETPRPESP